MAAGYTPRPIDVRARETAVPLEPCPPGSAGASGSSRWPLAARRGGGDPPRASFRSTSGTLPPRAAALRSTRGGGPRRRLCSEGVDERTSPAVLSAQVGIGILIALAVVIAVRTLARSYELHVYAAGLVVAAAIYLLAALSAAASASWLGLELGGVVLFGALAFFGLRTHPAFLGLGWCLHVAWDAFLSADLVSPWYPGLCAGFDLVLGAYILARSRGPMKRAENPRGEIRSQERPRSPAQVGTSPKAGP